jgi:hypothetical protein
VRPDGSDHAEADELIAPSGRHRLQGDHGLIGTEKELVAACHHLG